MQSPCVPGHGAARRGGARPLPSTSAGRCCRMRGSCIAACEEPAVTQVESAPTESGILPLVLTHGTLEIRDVQKSMHFYRDFLGMSTVQHVPRGCRISLGGDLYIICLEARSAYEMPQLYHWGLDTASKEDVDRWHQRALAEQ